MINHNLTYPSANWKFLQGTMIELFLSMGTHIPMAFVASTVDVFFFLTYGANAVTVLFFLPGAYFCQL